MKASAWRLRYCAEEALRNTNSALPRLLLALTVIGLATTWVTLAEISAADAAISLHERVVDQGGFVVVARDDQGLDGRACAAMAALPFVVAAGAARNVGSIEMGDAPATSFRLVTADQGVLAVWVFPRARAGSPAGLEGYYVGERVATELGVHEGGALLPLDAEPLVVLGILDVADRNPTADRAVIEIVPPLETADECWVEFDARDFSYAEGVTAAILGGGPGLSVSPLLRSDEFTRSASQELSNRTSRFAWIPISGLSVLFLWVGLWFRRREVGLYRALGMGPQHTLYMGQIETLVIGLLGGLAGFGFALDLALASHLRVSTDVVFFAGRSAVSFVLVVLALAPVPYAFLGRRSVAGLLKDS